MYIIITLPPAHNIIAFNSTLFYSLVFTTVLPEEEGNLLDSMYSDIDHCLFSFVPTYNR